jgi:hypothetical protein
MQIHIDIGPWCFLLSGHCGPKVVHHEEEEPLQVADVIASHELGFQASRAYESEGEYSDEPYDRA